MWIPSPTFGLGSGLACYQTWHDTLGSGLKAQDEGVCILRGEVHDEAVHCIC